MPFTDEQKTKLREQFRMKLRFVEFPIHGFKDILPALPFHPNEIFEIQGWQVTSLELGQRFAASGVADWPYEDLDSLITDIIAALEATES